MKNLVFLLKLLLSSFFIVKATMASQSGIASSLNKMTADCEAELIATSRQKLQQRTDLTGTTEDTLKIFDELSQSRLGKFLIMQEKTSCQNLNDLIQKISNPEAEMPLTRMDNWLINEAPFILALQEKVATLERQLARLNEVGVMFTLIPHNLTDKVEEINLGSDNHMVKLYREHYNALMPGNALITSFLTPPPYLSQESSWQSIDMNSLGKQRVIFEEILGIKPYFRTEEQTISQLERAGLRFKEIIYDTRLIFPTVIAVKPCN